MDTTPEQAAEGMAIVQVLAAVLDRLVGANASIARADPGQITKFHALKAPGIRIQQYLERVHKYASCSNECFILALIYIDRLIQRNNFLLTELNVHRVVITAILLAAKFFDDAYYNNAYYAKVGGVLVLEMNGLEVDFLFRINFSLHVTPDLFSKYHAELASHSVGSGISPQPDQLRIPSLPNSPHIQAAAVIVPPTQITTAMPPQTTEPSRGHRLLQHTDHGRARSFTSSSSSRHHPTHISPSPPPPQQPLMPVGYTDENGIISSQNCDSFGMLQRHNSAPPARRCSPHMTVNYNAPGPQTHMGDYAVVDHSAYPMHSGGGGGPVGSQIHSAGVDMQLVPNGNYHSQGQPDGAAQSSHGQALTQHYVGGQMLSSTTRGF